MTNTGSIIILTYCIILLIAKGKNNEKTYGRLKGCAVYVYFVLIAITWLTHSSQRVRTVVLSPNITDRLRGHESLCIIFTAAVIAYIPYGVLWLKKINGKRYAPLKAFGVCVATSALMEIMQYIFACGIMSLVDIEAAAIGSSLGIAVYGIRLIIKRWNE